MRVAEIGQDRAEALIGERLGIGIVRHRQPHQRQHEGLRAFEAVAVQAAGRASPARRRTGRRRRRRPPRISRRRGFQRGERAVAVGDGFCLEQGGRFGGRGTGGSNRQQQKKGGCQQARKSRHLVSSGMPFGGNHIRILCVAPTAGHLAARLRTEALRYIGRIVYRGRSSRCRLRVSNYPLSYKLSWLPRFLKPSLSGDRQGFAPAAGTMIEPPPARTVRLAFVGDISAVANRSAPQCDPAIATLLASADLVVGNCESPVVERPSAAMGTKLGTHHAMTERFLAEALAAVGISRDKLVLSLANNHVLDQGVEGFDETVAALERLGIRSIGTAAAGPVECLAVGPLTIGFAAFTLWRNAGAAVFAGRVIDAEASRHDGRAATPST